MQFCVLFALRLHLSLQYLHILAVLNASVHDRCPPGLSASRSQTASRQCTTALRAPDQIQHLMKYMALFTAIQGQHFLKWSARMQPCSKLFILAHRYRLLMDSVRKKALANLRLPSHSMLYSLTGYSLFPSLWLNDCKHAKNCNLLDVIPAFLPLLTPAVCIYTECYFYTSPQQCYCT